TPNSTTATDDPTRPRKSTHHNPQPVKRQTPEHTFVKQPGRTNSPTPTPPSRHHKLPTPTHNPGHPRPRHQLTPDNNPDINRPHPGPQPSTPQQPRSSRQPKPPPTDTGTPQNGPRPAPPQPDYRQEAANDADKHTEQTRRSE